MGASALRPTYHLQAGALLLPLALFSLLPELPFPSPALLVGGYWVTPPCSDR